jgi:hypothetical protein
VKSVIMVSQSISTGEITFSPLISEIIGTVELGASTDVAFRLSPAPRMKCQSQHGEATLTLSISPNPSLSTFGSAKRVLQQMPSALSRAP